MSVDSIASNIQNYHFQPAQSIGRAFKTDDPAAGSSSASPTTPSGSAPAAASGSLQGMSSDLQNILLQLQSSSGSGTAEAGNPLQAAKGVRPHHHPHNGGTQQAGAPGGSAQSGAVAQSAASAISVLSAG